MTPTPQSRTVAQKMGIATGSRAYLAGAPASAVAAMELPDLDVSDELIGQFDYLHLFVTTQDELRAQFAPMRDRLRRGGALWASWPKGGRLGTDLNLKRVIAIGYELNMVESTCLRIDDVWSALKFTHPKRGKTYANSYGTLPGQGGRRGAS